jgi:hypothetical protein
MENKNHGRPFSDFKLSESCPITFFSTSTFSKKSIIKSLRKNGSSISGYRDFKKLSNDILLTSTISKKSILKSLDNKTDSLKISFQDLSKHDRHVVLWHRFVLYSVDRAIFLFSNIGFLIFSHFLLGGKNVRFSRMSIFPLCVFLVFGFMIFRFTLFFTCLFHFSGRPKLGNYVVSDLSRYVLLPGSWP